MRVISGIARGTKLISPEGLNTRPTLDRIKESLFNIISQDLLDIDFLDLFSGTGSIGIEALSRGAKTATFVDNSKESIGIINKNLDKTKFKENSLVLNQDVSSAIDHFKNNGKSFSVIFMDPPYEKDFTKKTLEQIYIADILKKDGFIVCEQHIKESEPCVDGFSVFKIKEYKITKMTFLAKS